MRILADKHHGDLFTSLCILFEDRLGWEVYCPIGTDWYDEGYWLVYDHPATVEQYLGLGHIEPLDVHGTPVTKAHGQQAWLNKIILKKENGVHFVLDHGHGGRIHRAIELQTAKETGFDIVLSSMPQHFRPYERFRKQFCPHAKHIFQVGNVNWPAPPGVKNLLNSTTMIPPAGVNHVRYHQEFSLEEFAVVPCPNPRSLANLMHFQRGNYEEQFRELTRWLLAAGWDVKDYGAGNPDGPVDDIAAVIQRTGFIWHCKKGGDGYGHNIHNAFACGRPMVVACSQYHGLMAESLFKDGHTIIDLDKHSIPEIAGQLERAAASHAGWSANVRERFDQIVNFDAEFEQIKQFMERLT